MLLDFIKYIFSPIFSVFFSSNPYRVAVAMLNVSLRIPSALIIKKFFFFFFFCGSAWEVSIILASRSFMCSSLSPSLLFIYLFLQCSFHFLFISFSLVPFYIFQFLVKNSPCVHLSCANAVTTLVTQALDSLSGKLFSSVPLLCPPRAPHGVFSCSLSLLGFPCLGEIQCRCYPWWS